MRKPATKAKPAPTRAGAPATAGPRFPAWLPALLLVLVTVLAYLPVRRAGFIWDDERHVTDNRQVVAPDGWKQIWFSRESIQYYPVVFSTFRLERSLWGLNPAPYHWFNVLLHAGSALLLWRVLRHLRLPGAWLGAALFALHPVNVESVAWISQRKNVLAMLFYLLSLLCFLRSDPKPHPSALSRRLWYLLSLAAFVLGLLSKTAVAPLPLVLLGLAWWQRGRVTWRDVWRSAPFFAAALVLGLITVWFERHVNELQIVRQDSFWSRLACAGWAVWFYLYKLLLPLNLVPIYPRWQVAATNVVSYVPGLLALGGLLLCWRHRGSWGKAGLVCGGYYLLLLLPVLGFVNIGFMTVSLVADHWQYFAMIGPVALVAGVLGSRFNALGWRLGAAVLVVVLGGLTWRQSRLYADPEALWRATLAVNPACWAAHNNLGSALVSQGQPAEALAHYRETIRLEPGYAEPHNNLGSALVMLGQSDEALGQFQEALRLNPHFPAAYYNFGNALLGKGQTDEAIRLYRDALRLIPDDASIHNRLGEALHQKGRVDEAIPHYREAIRLQPDDADAHYNLGNALFGTGQTDAAIGHYQEAVRLAPDHAQAHNNLGSALLSKGRVNDALLQYQEAVRLAPDYAEAHYNLGNGLYQQGRISEAIAQFREALRLRPDLTEARNNLNAALATKPDAGKPAGASPNP